MRLPVQSTGSALSLYGMRPPVLPGVRASLANEGGDGCPDGMLKCSCKESSMCCNAYTEYCFTSPGGSCGCVKKGSGGVATGFGGRNGVTTVGTTGLTFTRNIGSADNGIQHNIGVTHYAN